MLKESIQCHIPILPVKSVSETLAYYKDVLGFEVAWIWDDDGYAAVRCGEVEIHLDRQDHISQCSSYLFVTDADLIYELYKSRGVPIIRNIESKPWGVREFTFQDINGHMFRVAHSEQ